MNNPKNILIKYNSSIKKALMKLEATSEKLLICISGNGSYVGVITDGDIRRAILSKANIDQSIEKYINRSSVFIKKAEDFETALNKINQKIQVVPVIGSKKEVIGYYSLRDRYSKDQIKNNNIIVIGLGYVGLTLAMTLAEAKFKVFGYDNNKELVNKLKKGIPSFYEKGLQKYIDSHLNKNFSLLKKIKKDTGSVFILAVGTPINKNNFPNLNNMQVATKLVGKNLKKGDIVILRSTIPIGTTREKIIPILQKESKLLAGRDFYISVSPERTAEGVAMKELKINPQIVGSIDELSRQKTTNLFNTFTHSIVNVGSLEAAEFAKLMDNAYRDHRFAFINQMIALSEKIGIDLTKLVYAVNHGYNRNDIPIPSPGVGGPCLSKDPHILASTFKKLKLNPELIIKSREVNEKQIDFLINKLSKLLKKIGKNINSSKIFLIGLAFKGEPETNDTRKSTSLLFLKKLKNKNNIFAYDYEIDPKIIKIKLKIKPISISSGFKKADAVIFLNNHKSYQNLNLSKLLSGLNKPMVLIDTWHNFDPSEVRKYKKVIYGGLGVG